MLGPSVMPALPPSLDEVKLAFILTLCLRPVFMRLFRRCQESCHPPEGNSGEPAPCVEPTEMEGSATSTNPPPHFKVTMAPLGASSAVTPSAIRLSARWHFAHEQNRGSTSAMRSSAMTCPSGEHRSFPTSSTNERGGRGQPTMSLLQHSPTGTHGSYNSTKPSAHSDTNAPGDTGLFHCTATFSSHGNHKRGSPYSDTDATGANSTASTFWNQMTDGVSASGEGKEEDLA